MGYEEVENGLERICRTSVNWLNEIDEFFLKAYESSALYKEKMKKYHDLKIEKTRVYGWGFGAFIQF